MITITLDTEVTLLGETTKNIQMRCFSTKEYLDSVGKTDEKNVVFLIHKTTGLTDDVIYGLDFADYMRLQAGIESFFADGVKAKKQIEAQLSSQIAQA